MNATVLHDDFSLSCHIIARPGALLSSLIESAAKDFKRESAGSMLKTAVLERMESP